MDSCYHMVAGVFLLKNTTQKTKNMQEIMIIGMIIMTAANIGIMLYIAICLNKITAVYDSVLNRSMSLKTYVNTQREQILLNRKESNRLYEEIRVCHKEIQVKYSTIKKIADETTQKASSCQYKYEYTDSTV